MANRNSNEEFDTEGKKRLAHKGQPLHSVYAIMIWLHPLI